MSNNNSSLPLDGIKVLELAHIVAGPSAGMMLADLGADVIKVEHPDIGDTARNQANNGASFLSFNRNKRSIAINLAGAEGKEIFERLVKRSDVVLNNYVPGALDRLGLGYDWARSVNPGIIYAAVKGFLPGPNWDRPLLDELAQMAGGLAFLTGPKGQPLRAGASVTDIGAATYAVLGILAALFKRNRTGLGENIESGLFETIVFWLSQAIARVQITGEDAKPRGNSNTSGMGKNMGWGVYQLFTTKDERQIFLAVTSNRHWAGLCEVLGLHDWANDPSYNSNRKRSALRQVIALRVADSVKAHAFDDLVARLAPLKVPFAPVNSPMTLLQDDHLAKSHQWIEVATAAAGPVRVPKMPLYMQETTFALRREPPTLGQHTDEILADLGYDVAEIDVFKGKRVAVRSDRLLNIDNHDQ